MAVPRSATSLNGVSEFCALAGARAVAGVLFAGACGGAERSGGTGGEQVQGRRAIDQDELVIAADLILERGDALLQLALEDQGEE